MEIVHRGRYRRVDICVVQGDLCEVPAECLVVPGNSMGKMGGGCSAAIRKAAGQEAETETIHKAPIPVGTSVLIKPHNLEGHGVKFIGYCSIMWKPVDTTSVAIIRNAVTHLLNSLDKTDCRSVAIPLMGTGVGHLPFSAAAEAILDAFKAYQLKKVKAYPIRQLFLVGYYEKSTAALVEALDALYRHPIKRAAIVVVDLIEPFVGEHALISTQVADDIVSRINPLVGAAEGCEIPVIYVKDVHDPSDSELIYAQHHCVGDPNQIALYPKLRIASNRSEIINKHTYSAFFGTDLAQKLAQEQCETLLIVGTQTHVCVKFTAADALFHGFRPIVVADCTAASSPERHKAGLAEVRDYIGEISNSQVLTNVLNNSGVYTDLELENITPKSNAKKAGISP